MFSKRILHLVKTKRIEPVGVEGTYATAYLLPNNKILKVMKDSGQVDFLQVFGNKGKHFPRFEHWRSDIESRDQYIVMERLIPLSIAFPDTWEKLINRISKDAYRNDFPSNYSDLLGTGSTLFEVEFAKLKDLTEKLGMYFDVTFDNIMARPSNKEVVFLDVWA